MSEMIVDEIPPSNGSAANENHPVGEESGGHQEDVDSWLYGKQKPEENMDNNTAPSIDEVTTQEIDSRDIANASPSIMPLNTSLIGDQLDDDSDDDDIQVTIGNIKTGPSIFPSRQNSRTMMPAVPAMPVKPQAPRGIDLDAQGVINGQSTYEYDMANAYKDDEKPWKKPGADISDYFNYGFTEETWAQYCDRQRRLRAENNLARLNAAQMPQMPHMMGGHPPMMHPMNNMPMMVMNKQPMNMQMMPRPYMNARKPDGKIDVIGATDQTSRRQMFEMQNNFDHPPFLTGPQFAGGQPPNGQTVGDLVPTTPTSNGPPPAHGTPPGTNRPIPTLGAHRMPIMPPPPGMAFRPQYGHPHGPGGPPFFPHGPGGPMHGERPQQPFFVSHHPQQPWDKGGVPPVHNFQPGHFPPQAPVPGNSGNGRLASSRSPTPEDHSSRSSTPEESRPSGTAGDADKSSKDDRYKDRYRDDRDHYSSSSSRRRPPSKDRSTSAYGSRHRSGDHEYERPRGDRKSSRDRDDKYERYSRKRHHRDDSGRHHRGDEDSSRSRHSSHRTPSKNFSSPPKTISSTSNPVASGESSQPSTENPESTANDPVSNSTAPAASSSPNSRSRRDESERSSSRHSHHKKSSKRSRRDSGDDRSHHHRRSKDKSSSSKKSSNPTETSSSDVKDSQND